MDKGYMHVYYGFGKGKTTAALGLALRAAGNGRKVVIVQFLKSAYTGELAPLSLLPGVTVLRGQAGSGFARGMSAARLKETKRIHNENLKTALERVRRGECDMLILDEALDACQLDLIDGPLFEGAVREKPERLELVITGHMPEPWILECADYVSEIVKKKHPYDSGVAARAGVEY
jgi:cob(I)alamin adenosyltransferase